MRIKINEVLRYLGAGRFQGFAESSADESRTSECTRSQSLSELKELSARIAQDLENRLKPRYILKESDLERTEKGYYRPQADLLLSGSLAETMLSECRKAVLLVCTLGAGFESMMRTWQARDLAKAVILDACGNAYVEAGCDEAEETLRSMHPSFYLTDRFSPGYGDLPLSLQKQVIAAADAGKRLGVEVLESDLLNPSKTVTAFIGISDKPQKAKIRGCAFCVLRENCEFRRKRQTCWEV